MYLPIVYNTVERVVEVEALSLRHFSLKYVSLTSNLPLTEMAKSADTKRKRQTVMKKKQKTLFSVKLS